MKKAVITLMMLTASATAFAQGGVHVDQQKVDSDMQQLSAIKEEGAAFIMIDEDSSYVAIEYVGKWEEINNYVSHKEAKQRKLEKVNKRFVYSQTGETLASLEQKIVDHIQAEQPKYFSVDVYRDYHGASGEFNYLARVVEYN
ncbi:hypothetical protein ACTJ2Z_000245 [Vibrio vulnificus]|uniref:hypothetical protein n=1 Tax=Vibrio vulnificus TaxID=672 RepID=UPI0010288776|nr:hypothetical protein [Vibrio vulnificus]RZP67429.1 hypothetical protein D8T53_13320 [Vibrio vulnificus]HAS8198088.1 hypothetical protein [Vibrio vulnificus]HAS8248773.1 hypothetical protein [Vibrio vulnificus]